MIFASTHFIFAFLVTFFIFYYALGKIFGLTGKNIVLLIFSLIFYAWGEPIYVLLMVYSTCLDYTCGRMIEKGTLENKQWLRKLFLTISLIGNLIPLSLFKYADMFLLTTNHLFDLSIPLLNLTLPIGISFYTFQTMSYSIDVYKNKIPAQKNILYFGTYVTMFPQLIAGPVVRYSDVEKELNFRTESTEGIAQGLRRFFRGLAKKVLIANTMAAVCDSLFPIGGENLGVLGSWIAILSYTFQIYYDFSGYSDMAIGLGKMMGFNYPENFNYPYIAKSITDFWRRWHITMSTFFRDYVYIPLGGNRVSKLRWLFNILIVWALTGLWHGASWNFVLWGLYFAIILIIEKYLIKKFIEKTHVLSRIYSLFLIIIGWVLFNATEEFGGLSWFINYIKAMFGFYGIQGTSIMKPAIIALTEANVNLIFIIIFVFAIIFSTPIVPFISNKVNQLKNKSLQSFLLCTADIFEIVLFLVCIVELAIGSYNPFIYFRF